MQASKPHVGHRPFAKKGPLYPDLFLSRSEPLLEPSLEHGNQVPG